MSPLLVILSRKNSKWSIPLTDTFICGTHVSQKLCWQADVTGWKIPFVFDEILYRFLIVCEMPYIAWIVSSFLFIPAKFIIFLMRDDIWFMHSYGGCFVWATASLMPCNSVLNHRGLQTSLHACALFCQSQTVTYHSPKYPSCNGIMFIKEHLLV